jgi:YVTN family beta-propeller protein
VAPELNRGWISNGRSNNVTVFDLKTLKATGQVPTGGNPDSIRYDAASGRVFTFNGRSNDATAIDAKTGAVAGTIALGGKPEFSQVDGKGMLFVNIEDSGEIAVVDTKKLVVAKRYSLDPCKGPSGLAFDAKDRRLFSVCGNRLMAVSDPDTGKVLVTLPIGAGSDGVAFDPSTGMAMSSNGDGTMTIVQQTGNKWDVVENIATERGARTIAVDDKTHRIYMPTAATAPAAGGGRATFLPDSFKVIVVGK